MRRKLMWMRHMFSSAMTLAKTEQDSHRTQVSETILWGQRLHQERVWSCDPMPSGRMSLHRSLTKNYEHSDSLPTEKIEKTKP